MAKRKRGGLKSESTDSFLDLLFNVIGILVLIVAFAAIASVTTSQVRGISLAAKSSASKEQLNIVCNGGRCVHADYENQDELQKYFAMRMEQRRVFLTPKRGWPGWWREDDLKEEENELLNLFINNPVEKYDISLLIFQDSFTIASRIETMGRNSGYAFRHVFFKTGETLEFSRQKITVN